MWTFAFDAPELYGASPGRQRRLAVWLRDKLLTHDVPALGPHLAQQGWALSINADDGFVFILLILNENTPSEARIDYSGAAEVEAEDTARAVEDILAASPALRLLEAAC